ncbi:transposable element Tcb1 transposase [Trichonephila clavipes]|nr:transposable element Tcb1 transposase [Trichonephila clavipes]
MPSSQEDRHVTRIALMDRAATSRALNQDIQGRLQDKSVFNGVINDEPGCTNGETSFFQMNPSSVYSIKMVAAWGTHIESVHSSSAYWSLVRIDSTLNSAGYISGVLRSVALPFIRAQRNPMFQQDNARRHVAGIVRTFLDTEDVRLLPRPARSPDLSPTENVWSIVVERLARSHTPVTMVDELWHRVTAAWPSVFVHVIQSLFDSMPRRISDVITARGGCSGY